MNNLDYCQHIYDTAENLVQYYIDSPMVDPLVIEQYIIQLSHDLKGKQA